MQGSLTGQAADLAVTAHHHGDESTRPFTLTHTTMARVNRRHVTLHPASWGTFCTWTVQLRESPLMPAIVACVNGRRRRLLYTTVGPTTVRLTQLLKRMCWYA